MLTCRHTLALVLVAILVVLTTPVHGTDIALSADIKEGIRRSLLGSLGETADTTPPHAFGGCGTLACWLAQLSFSLPSESFEVADVKGSLSNLVCHQVIISALDSKLVKPQGLGVTASGVAIQCSGDWSLGLASDGVGASSGSVDIAVDDTSAAFSVFLETGAHGLATAAEMKNCALDVHIASVTFHGDPIESFLLKLVADVVEKFAMESIEKAACSAVDTLASKNITYALQEIDARIEPCMTPAPPPPPVVFPPGMVVMPGNPVVGLLDYVLDMVVGYNGSLGINKIVNRLTNNTGSLTLTNLTSFQVTLPLGTLANVSLGVSTLQVQGLDTWTAFDLLVPQGPYTLGSWTDTEMLAVNVTFWVNVSLPQEGVVTDVTLSEAGMLSARLLDNRMNISAAVGLYQSQLANLHPNQLTSPGCLLDCVYTLNVTELWFNTSVAQVDLVYEEASYADPPNTQPAGSDSLAEDLDMLVTRFLALVLDSFGGAVPAIFDCLAAEPLMEMVNTAIARELHSITPPPGTPGLGAEELLCEQAKGPPLTWDPVSTAQAFGGALALFLFLALFLCLNANAQVADKTHPVAVTGERAPLLRVTSGVSLQAGTTASNDDDGEEQWDEGEEQWEEVEEQWEEDGIDLDTAGASQRVSRCCKRMQCLSVDPVFPWVVRYGVPLLLLLNIALFISSNTAVGASVYVFLTIGDDQIRLPSVFSFSLGNSVKDMWQAGVYPLSLMIALFSGAWPYAKLLLMLVCWLMPINWKPWMNEQRREVFIMFLDALGKWSLIDSYVMVMMLVAFRIHISAPAVSMAGVSAGATAVDVIVEPDFGFYGFLLATMMSLVMTHIILAFHRKAAHVAVQKAEAITLVDKVTLDAALGGTQRTHSEASSLHVHAFRFRVWRSLAHAVRWFITLLLVMSTLLLFVGLGFPSFDFEFGGAIGLVFEYLAMPTTRSYSVFSLGMQLPHAAYTPNGFGIRWIQATFLLFAAIIPVMHLASLLVLWMVPLRHTAQRRLFRLSEVLNAWSSLDVFIVAVMAALLELRQFAAFIVGDKCDMVNKILAQYFGPALHGDDRCFDVRAHLLKGCWLLFSACVMYIIATIVLMKTCHSAMAARDQLVKDKAAKAQHKTNTGVIAYGSVAT